MAVIDEIAAERKRQIEDEGWSSAHDDTEHRPGELANAAACYAAPDAIHWPLEGAMLGARLRWRWDKKFWKPKGRRRDLIRAAALIIAEIEKCDRFALHNEETSHG